MGLRVGWSLTGLFNLIGLWGFEHAPTTSKVRYISRESEKGEGGERQQWEQGEREREETMRVIYIFWREDKESSGRNVWM